MANALPPGFQGTDFSQWGSWQPITIDGLPYYQVPGHDQYVFDPYDGPYGSIKINPKYVEAAYNAENPEPGLVDQIVPAIGTIGGLYLSNQLFNPSTATATGAEVAGQAGNSSGFFGNLFGSGAEGQALGSSAALNEGVMLGDSMLATSAFDPSTANVADIFSQGGGESALGGVTPYLGAAGAAYGAYNMYEGLKEGDMGQTGMGAAGVGLGINAMGYALGPWGWGALAAATLASKLTKHESTRDVAKKHTKSLMNQGKDDATWQNYVATMRKGFDKAPVNPSKPFAGKYATWQEYEAAGLEAPDLTGVYGNLKTFGPQWAKLSEDQRVAVTQGIINAGLYKSKKGEVEITDPSKAKTIYESVLAQGVTPSTQKATTQKASLSTGDEKMKAQGMKPLSKAQKDWVDKYLKDGKTADMIGTQPIRGNPQANKSNMSAMDLARSVAGGGGAPRTGGGVQLAPKMAPPSNMPQRQMPGAQPSMGQAIAQQVQPQPLQRPVAQPQTDTADWLMKLRQRAMAQPQAMMGQTPPIYSRG